MRFALLALALLPACAGTRPKPGEDLCRTLREERRTLAEKASECETISGAAEPPACAPELAACTDADLALIAAEARCVQGLPRCIDPQSCKGDSCVDATPGAGAAWRDQRDACRRLSADVSPGCAAALQGAR